MRMRTRVWRGDEKGNAWVETDWRAASCYHLRPCLAQALPHAMLYVLLLCMYVRVLPLAV